MLNRMCVAALVSRETDISLTVVNIHILYCSISNITFLSAAGMTSLLMKGPSFISY